MSNPLLKWQLFVIIVGKSYSRQEKGVKNYVRVDNKYFNPLKQHSLSFLTFLISAIKHINKNKFSFGKIRVCKYWL